VREVDGKASRAGVGKVVKVYKFQAQEVTKLTQSARRISLLQTIYTYSASFFCFSHKVFAATARQHNSKCKGIAAVMCIAKRKDI
jgi:hypothetical protein